MLETCQVASKLDLPAVTHIDNSCRPQTVNNITNPIFAKLLEVFYQRTGCPILVNTSFNIRDEPIVRTPLDALKCFGHSDLDVLVLGSFIIDRKMLPEMFSVMAGIELDAVQPSRDAFSGGTTGGVYTFI